MIRSDQVGRQWRAIVTGEQHPGTWNVPTPQVIDCQHPHGDDRPMCPDCLDQLQWMLGDIPALVEQLHVAIRRDTVFRARGIRRDHANTDTDGDTGPLLFNPAPSKALHRLMDAIAYAPGHLSDPAGASRVLLRNWTAVLRWPDLADWATKVSAAVRHAHAVIDRPPDDWPHGNCPTCDTEIRGERHPDTIRCPRCTYTADPDTHRHNLITAADNRQMTVAELVAAFAHNGTPIPRQRLDNWITNAVNRHGFPRERRVDPVWRNGRLDYSKEVWTYRLRDVRELVQQKEGAA